MRPAAGRQKRGNQVITAALYPLSRTRSRLVPLGAALVAAALVPAALVPAATALAQNGNAYFAPNNLLVSRSVYDNNPSNVVAGATQLPPGCAGANCVTAVAD